MADISIADDGREARAPRHAAPLAGFAAALAAEGERQVLWVPVLFGSGIALYFALTVEPPLWLGPTLLLPSVASAFLLRHRRAWRGPAICLAFAAAGFAWIAETSRERAAPMLDHRLGPLAITGRVVDIDT